MEPSPPARTHSPRTWPTDVPPILRRGPRIGALLLAAMLAGFVAMALLMTPWGRPFTRLVYTYVIVTVAARVCWTMLEPVLMRRRIKQQVIDADYQLCGYCGHSLRESVEDGRCPECAEPFDAIALRRYWRRFCDPRDPHLVTRYMQLRMTRSALWLPAVMLVGVGLLVYQPTQFGAWVIVPAIFLVSGLGTLFTEHRDRVFCRRLVTGGFLLCGHCGRELPAGVEAPCARCGRQFDRDELREKWQSCFPLHWEAEMARRGPAAR